MFIFEGLALIFMMLKDFNGFSMIAGGPWIRHSNVQTARPINHKVCIHCVICVYMRIFEGLELFFVDLH